MKAITGFLADMHWMHIMIVIFITGCGLLLHFIGKKPDEDKKVKDSDRSEWEEWINQGRL